MTELFRREAVQAKQSSSFGHVHLRSSGSAWAFAAISAAVAVAIAGVLAFGSYSRTSRLVGVLVADPAIIEVRAPSAGRVANVLVGQGGATVVGQPMFVMQPSKAVETDSLGGDGRSEDTGSDKDTDVGATVEAFKGLEVISADATGTISTVLVVPGKFVKRNQVIATIIPRGAQLQATFLVTSKAAPLIRPGTRFEVKVPSSGPSGTRRLGAVVRTISQGSLSADQAYELYGIRQLDPMYKLDAALVSEGRVDPTSLMFGMPVEADYVLSSEPIWRMITGGASP